MIKKLARSILNNKNIIEKKEIDLTVQFIDENSFKSKHIFSDIGEDAASIKDNDKFVLVTTDRIKTDYIMNYPFGAGFSSILVGIDDIFCCGGIPLAASLILSFKDSDIGQQIVDGICEGSNKFKVPIIRGHTNPNSDHYELSSTLIGEIKKNAYISAKTAKVNDDIILAVDFEGKVAKASKYYWDTVTFKTSEVVLKKRTSLNSIAEKKIANSSKDISNGGIFGTTLQLIKYSNVGADINVKSIRIPPNLVDLDYSIEDYAKMYLTTSYILTASSEYSEEILSIFKKFGLHASIIGKIIQDTHLLRINDGETSVDVLKF